MTEKTWEEKWRELAAPFPKSEIRYKPGRMNSATKKKSPDMAYVTSRQVMNRLDQVLTPGGWYDSFQETPLGVVATIYVLTEQGWIGKSDIGLRGEKENIEREKGNYSDAFKRAGVKWGIARELYGDGVAYDFSITELTTEEKVAASKRTFMEEMNEEMGLTGIEIKAYLESYGHPVDWLNADSIQAFSNYIGEQ